MITTGEYSTVVQHTRLFRGRLWLRHSPLLLLRRQRSAWRWQQPRVSTLHHSCRRTSTVISRSTTEPHRSSYHPL